MPHISTEDKTIWKNLLPESAIDYCIGLWQKYDFTFKVTSARKSKYGDYSFNPKLNTHTITVNGDLHPEAFLITFLHEVAHLQTYQQHGRKVLPHGNEWKTNFRLLLEPVLLPQIFSTDVLTALKVYSQRPRASTHAFSPLSEALQKLSNQDHKHGKLLIDVPFGQHFEFQNRTFIRGPLNRTRILCKEVSSQQFYTIPSRIIVKVNDIQ
jgi:SprT protein